MTIVDSDAAPNGAPHTAPGAHADGARAAIALRGATKAFGRNGDRVLALDGVDLTVAPGEFVCVVGASGCGKSTMLNLVAGLDTPSAGEVEAAGTAALMFQDAALFPWLTAVDNVALPLRLRRVSKTDRRKRAEELLSLVHLSGQGRR
ncbi:MAG TPA: ATP-binding cassette domain-containing protein, partial [Acidimicrobiales bacterium]